VIWVGDATVAVEVVEVSAREDPGPRVSAVATSAATSRRRGAGRRFTAVSILVCLMPASDRKEHVMIDRPNAHAKRRTYPFWNGPVWVTTA
jgi:hypothetical protein